MSPDERRAHILDAVIPLFVEHGADVTSRQIAEAAGVAEGTVFRAFADKEALIAAVVARVMDPAPIAASLSEIPVELALEPKLRRMVDVLRARFEGVLGLMNALGMKEAPAPPRSSNGRPRGEVSRRLLEPHRDELRVEPGVAVTLIRLLCFSVSVPTIADEVSMSTDAIVDLILHGISKEGH